MPNVRFQEGSLTRNAADGPVPQVDVRFRAEFTVYNPKSGFALVNWRPEVQLAQVPIPVASVTAPNVPVMEGSDFNSGEFGFRLLLFPHIIEAIEASRSGDVKGSISAWFYYVELQHRVRGTETTPWLMASANAPTIPLNYSRDEWAELLDQLHYDGAWVVEVVPPALAAPGWETVVELLEGARRELRGHQPGAAAQKCRDAWEAASPFLVDRWEDAKSLMSRGAKAPSRYTAKPERIATTYDDISNLLNDVRFLSDTAKHGAEHTVTDEDALLIYRLSHSMLAYLSRTSKRSG